jgi:hypothetical protein
MSSEYHHKIHISKTPQEKQELRKTIIEKFMTKYRVSDNMNFSLKLIRLKKSGMISKILE